MQLWQNQKTPNLYPNMWKIIFKLQITFTISYYYVLLRTTSYYFVLLRTTSYYFVLLSLFRTTFTTSYFVEAGFSAVN